MRPVDYALLAELEHRNWQAAEAYKCPLWEAVAGFAAKYSSERSWREGDRPFWYLVPGVDANGEVRNARAGTRRPCNEVHGELG